MNVKFKELATNFSFTLTSNIVSMLISILIVLIVPKLIGINEYGYWQLYIFYSGYLGFFNIGWVEGIYLRYGGQNYANLNRNLFTSQFWSFFLYIIISGSIIAIYSFLYIKDYDKQFIFEMLTVCLIFSVPRGFLLFVLESTNRIKEFSKLTILDRVIYCVIIVLMILFGIRDFKLLIIADLLGKFTTLIIAMYICKEIVFSKMVPLKNNFIEILVNISVGIKLMFSNIASMLIIGVVRFGIEHKWDVRTFGKVSLTLSLANLMMLFINAVGIIMFPILRRTDEKKLQTIYITMRDFLMIILFGMLILYYPLKVLMSVWLPQYAESLKYMSLIFPMCVFEGKMSLLINTYLKTLRKEKLMLKINVLFLTLSIITTSITTVFLGNLNLAIVSIAILLALRCAFAEYHLSKILMISLQKDIILELVMTLIFIIIGWCIDSWLAVFLYSIAYLMYLVTKRKDFTRTAKQIKLLMKA